jgi:hypothetical protein
MSDRQEFDGFLENVDSDSEKDVMRLVTGVANEIVDCDRAVSGNAVELRVVEQFFDSSSVSSASQGSSVASDVRALGTTLKL